MKRINQIEPWIGEEEKQALMKYMDSGGWLTEFKTIAVTIDKDNWQGFQNAA